MERSPLKSLDLTMTNEKFPEELTLMQAAKYARITYQAIYGAVKCGRIPVTSENRPLKVLKKSVDDYRLSKYSPDLRKHNDEKVFDIESGQFSAPQAAKILSEELKAPYPVSAIYYEIYMGRLRPKKTGPYWVLEWDDIHTLFTRKKRKEEMDQLRFA